MVSLWGTSKKDDDDQNEGVRPQTGESSERTAAPRVSEADERTRLLPPRPREGYLSPDDPAVSSEFCPQNVDVLVSADQAPRFLHTTFGVFAG